MAENITSLLDKDELTSANALATDVIYIVHGTGTPRDKKMTVAELRKLIGGAAGDITVHSITFSDGTSTYTVELGADGNIFFNTGIATEDDIVAKGLAAGFDTALDAKSTIKGLVFKAGTLNNREVRAYITYVGDGKKLFLHADGSTGNEAIVLDGDTLIPSGKAIMGDVKTDDIYVKSTGSTAIRVHSKFDAVNLPIDFVSVDELPQTSAEAILEASKELLEKNYWLDGQVKRFLNTTNSDKIIALFSENGGNYTATIPQRSYVTLCCNGSVTVDGAQYAVCYRGA